MGGYERCMEVVVGGRVYVEGGVSELVFCVVSCEV